MRADGTVRLTLKNSRAFHDAGLLPDVVFHVPKHRVSAARGGARQLWLPHGSTAADACFTLEATVVRGAPTLMLDLEVGLVVALVPMMPRAPKKKAYDEDADDDAEGALPPQLVMLQHIEMAASGRRARILVRQLV